MLIAKRALLATAPALLGLLISGCGGSSPAGSGSASAGSSSPASSPSASAGAPSALSAEAKSLATGDIPDNQVFLPFRDAHAGYSIVYPEGWARRRPGTGVEFVERNNLIRLTVRAGAQPTTASVASELDRERRAQPSLSHASPSPISIAGAHVLKVSYTTVSAPSPVTGKRIRLTVDRYVFAGGGRVATLDLGTPAGVDNVDAYRRIAHSFRWLR